MKSDTRVLYTRYTSAMLRSPDGAWVTLGGERAGRGRDGVTGLMTVATGTVTGRAGRAVRRTGLVTGRAGSVTVSGRDTGRGTGRTITAASTVGSGGVGVTGVMAGVTVAGAGAAPDPSAARPIAILSVSSARGPIDISVWGAAGLAGSDQVSRGRAVIEGTAGHHCWGAPVTGQVRWCQLLVPTAPVPRSRGRENVRTFSNECGNPYAFSKKN